MKSDRIRNSGGPMYQRIQKCVAGLLLALVLNTAYLASFSLPTITYMSNVLLHLVLGLVFTAIALWLIVRDEVVRQIPIALFLFLSAAVPGLILAVLGNITENRWILITHIGIGGASLVAFLPFAWRQARFGGGYSVGLIL